MQSITPCLWFDNQAEEAVNFYISIFSALGGSTSSGKNSKIVSVARYGEAGAEVSGRPTGTVITMTFQLYGQEFMVLNGGPHFTFTPAISFLVNCETQEEVDELWEKLSDGGEIEECGWLKDKYGVSWQIVPALLGEMLQDKDAEKSERVMKAMLQMDKIDIETIKQAYERRSSSTASKERGQWTDRNRCFRIFTTSFGTWQHSLQGASYVHSRIFDIPGRRSGDAGKNRLGGRPSASGPARP